MNLSYVLNVNKELEGIMSRRFDGAFPSTINPILIWEIKEYYYTTTFGSRIADGVYETQLDGYEIKTIREETLKTFNIYTLSMIIILGGIWVSLIFAELLTCYIWA